MSESYDIVVVGGGVAGAALAARLARAGAAVLVVERELAFRDRVRGEVLYPWGVLEAERLGLATALAAGGARELPYWRTSFVGAAPPEPRDLRVEAGAPALAFSHPALQEALLRAAELSGARVWRGASVTGLTRTGGGVELAVRRRGEARPVRATLAVGADGRASGMRRLAGFATSRDRPRLVFAGVLLEGVHVPYTAREDDTAQLYFHPSEGLLAMLLPIGGGRTRVYAGYHLRSGRDPAVGRSLEAFLALATRAGTPAGALQGARAAGPLAAFNGADAWVERPYAEGVALVGDAAATSDPSFGSGLALTLLGVRQLAEALLAEPDLSPAAVERAGRAYATAQAASYGALHRKIDWLTDLYRTPGAEADALRARLYPLHAAEPWRVPDVVAEGPAGASDEAARRAFFGEDLAGAGAPG